MVKKEISCEAWIGHKSYIAHKTPTVSHIIFDTREEARNAGWRNPSKIKLTLLDSKP